VRVCAIAVIVAIVALAGRVTTAAADVSLVLPTPSLPGFHSTQASLRSARSDLAAGLSPGLAASVSRAQVQTAAASRSGLRVRSDAFVFGSAATAERVLQAWRRAHHAGRVAVGDRGYSFTHRIAHTTFVAWRSQSRLGVLALTDGRGVSGPVAVAGKYAVLADSWLRRPLPSTAWGKVLDQIRANGTVSKTTALQAVALLYGAVPGVKAPGGRPGLALSGDLAAGWILPYLSRLDAAQRRVLARRLGLRVSGRVVRRLGLRASGPVAHAACLFCDYGDPTFNEDATFQAYAEHWVSEYGSTALGPLGMQVVVGTASVPKKAPTSLFADAAAMNDADGAIEKGPPSICRIRLFPAFGATTPQGQGWILAHEVFHCFEDRILGAGAWSSAPGAWVMEGLATWAAFAVDPVNYPPAVQKILDYIADPHKVLFQRSYDAVGFWLHLEDLDHGPYFWSLIPAIVTGGGTTADFAASGANTSPFWDSWGSSFLRAVTGELNWDMLCPCSYGTALGFVPKFGALKPGGFESLSGSATVYAPSYGASQYQFDDAGPIVHVAISGYARLSTQYNYVDSGLHGAWFCIEPGPCVCPKGSTGQVPPTQPLEPMALLGLSGEPLTGTQGSIQFYKLSDLCEPQTQQPQPPSPGSGNPGVSNGDPYILTFDNGHYGFQTAGEFTLVKSTVDDLEIQSRQVPYRLVLGWGGNSLAMNTAFAMRDGGAIVEVDKGFPLTLYIDRRRRPAHSGETIALRGGGAVQYFNTKVIVSWADGTRATVPSIGSEGVNIYVQPSASRAGRLRGLLGSADGKLADDFIGRDGKRYNAAQIQSVGLFVSTPREVRILLGGFGRSWRITQAESLFVYPHGKSTRSYLVPGFPRAPLSLRSVPRRRLLAAAAACHRAGVTNAALLDGCEIDYGATGEERLASSAAALQQASGLPPARVDLSGRWSGQYSGAFNGTFTLTWTQTGTILNGTIKLSNPHDTLAIHGTVTGTGIKFGSVGFATYTGSVFSNVMSGHYNTPRGGGSWNATKLS
jgi:hypothetical protein